MSDSGGTAQETSRAEASTTTAARQAARFFIVPAIIVGVCVLCLLLAGGLYVLLQERNEPDEYLEQVVAGSGHRRWQAAYELSKVIAATDGDVDDAMAARFVQVFERAKDDDPRVRRYLALALGRVKRPGSVRALEGALSDRDAETRIYALWGLGSQGDPASGPIVARTLDDEDPGVRKMAAYALGFLPGEETVWPLRGALEDHAVDVRWNAAVALAQRGDGAGFDVLLGMIDRPSLEAISDDQGNRTMSGERIRDVMLTGLRGLVLLRDDRAEEAVRRLSRTEPDLKVRDAAIKALEEIGR